MADFFIERPVFAWVIAILIMLGGGLSVVNMPIEQYPAIAPPSVSITTYYPGASAETLENSVTQIIEQSLTGIDNMRYFSATSTASGNVAITVTLEPEADPDIAQVQIQNKVQAAMPLLPREVQNQGVVVKKAGSTFVFVIGFSSTNDEDTAEYIGDFISSNVADVIARVSGVGSVTVFAQPYAMRIWLDPLKLYSYNLSINEVVAAISEQNIDISAGQLGGLPALEGQQINATVLASSRLKSEEEFRNIILRVNNDGSQVRLGDVARIAKGKQTYGTIGRKNARPASGIGISLATNANALETAERVKAKLKEIAPAFPDGIEYSFPYDTTPYTRDSIKEVLKTLIEATILVFIVMYLFLQNFRATLIPSLAVPVVLLGTFGILSVCGFTINTLTMFAMVLAIGLLVDDAIVVVENVERVMSEEGLTPKEATIKSMGQITGALIGIAMVLSAVFVPMAFFSGSAGAIYRQFSITIVSAMGLSVLVALIWTPTLCIQLLKQVPRGHHEQKKGFWGWFNRTFNRTRSSFQKTSGYIARRGFRFLVIYLVLVCGMGYLFKQLPGSFLPDEDQGVIFVMIRAPQGSTAERTLESMKVLEQYLLKHEEKTVKEFFMVTGFSFAGRAQNAAMGFIMLKDFKERTTPDTKAKAVAGRIMRAMYPVKDAQIYAFFPPPIIELGNATGFDFHLVDRVGLGHQALTRAKYQLLGMAAQNPKLMAVRPNGLFDVPQFKVDIDSEKVRASGLSLAEVNSTLQIAWGSRYVNDFIDNGRVKRVYVQGDAPYRMQPEDMYDWYVKNNEGEMIPFDAFSSTRWVYGSPRLERFNGYSSMNIQGSPAAGVSSGEAMIEIEKIASQLPRGIGIEWASLSYEEKLAGAEEGALYALSLIIIFLSLAALYESWSIPFSVLLAVPLGIIGTVIATRYTGLTNDVYFKVGLLTTIGLCAKNAILIVEFARELHENGEKLYEAGLNAFMLRFRPIVMTSMAFILGVTPLALANGAGANSQRAIGIGVIGGMIAATCLAILFVPLFFSWMEKISGWKKS